MSKFKVNDWVWFEFELNQIKTMIGSKITELSTGVIRGYSTDFSDNVFPLTTVNKLISETYKRQYERLKDECRFANLNWPDIHRWFVQHWATTCREKPVPGTAGTYQDAYFIHRYEELYAFVDQVILACEPLKLARVKGIRLVTVR